MKFYAGTKKGLLTFESSGKGWNIVAEDFLGDPVPMLLPITEQDLLYAALGTGHFGSKLRRSKDGGKNWQDIPAPAYPEKDVEIADETPWSLELIWSLEAAGEEALWCGTIPGGLFYSKDGGDSWILNRSLWDYQGRKDWFGGGYDHPGIHSICVDPADKDVVTVGISIGGVHQSKDNGKSWSPRGTGLRADYVPPNLAHDTDQQDPHLIVQSQSNPSTFWMQHHNGIFVSNDNCGSWRELKDISPSTFGFAVEVHPLDENTAWFVPALKDESRIPVDGKLVINRTRDGGESFETLTRGLPQSGAYDLVYRHCLVIDESGEVMIMGSTTGNLWCSYDLGTSWKLISSHLPPILVLRFA